MTRLKKELADRHITQVEFARQVGVTQVAMSRYCNGTRTPRLKTAVQMANILCMDIEDLFPEVSA